VEKIEGNQVFVEVASGIKPFDIKRFADLAREEVTE
jgi:hypothetical protein